MPVNLDNLNAAVAAAQAEITRAITLEDGAGVLIQALKDANTTAVAAAVTAALAADNATTQSVVDAATKAIADSTAPFAASDDKIAAAILANTPSA